MLSTSDARKIAGLIQRRPAGDCGIGSDGITLLSAVLNFPFPYFKPRRVPRKPVHDTGRNRLGQRTECCRIRYTFSIVILSAGERILLAGVAGSAVCPPNACRPIPVSRNPHVSKTARHGAPELLDQRVSIFGEVFQVVRPRRTSCGPCPYRWGRPWRRGCAGRSRAPAPPAFRS